MIEIIQWIGGILGLALTIVIIYGLWVLISDNDD